MRRYWAIVLTAMAFNLSISVALRRFPVANLLRTRQQLFGASLVSIRTIRQGRTGVPNPSRPLKTELSAKPAATKEKEEFPLSFVSVENKTRRSDINTAEVTKQAKLLLSILGYEDFGVEVLFCSEQHIKKLNTEWREKDAATDVLSFPCNEFDEPEMFSKESKAMLKYGRQLGDIVIAPKYVLEQCAADLKAHEESLSTEAGRAELQAELASDAGCSRAMATIFTLQGRIPLLLIHSLLHLLGYDHETEEDWEKMTKKEDEIIDLYYEKMGTKVEERIPTNASPPL